MDLHLPTLLLGCAAAAGVGALAMSLDALTVQRYRGQRVWLAAQWGLVAALLLAPLREAGLPLRLLVQWGLLQWPLLLLIGWRRFEARQPLAGSPRADLAVGATALLATGCAELAAPASMLSLAVFSLALCALLLYAAAVLLPAPPARAAGGLLALAGAAVLGRLLVLLDAPLAPPPDELRAHALTIALAALALAFLCQHVQHDRGARELRESRRRLRVLANIDMLTRVPNRRHFLELGRRLLERDPPGSASVVMFDIDHFKRINDVLGHAAGDRALRLVSQCAQQSLRQRDVAGRHGGDEFALLLPRTLAHDAMTVAARIVGRIQLRAEQNDVPRLSLSFGVAQLHPGEGLEEALRRADQALYEAKRQGRSRAVVVEGNEDQPVFSESQRLGLTPH